MREEERLRERESLKEQRHKARIGEEERIKEQRHRAALREEERLRERESLKEQRHKARIGEEKRRQEVDADVSPKAREATPINARNRMQTTTPSDRVHLEQKEHEGRIQDYEEAIRPDPHNIAYYALAYNNRGLAHAKLGQYEQAIQDFEEGHQDRPAEHTCLLQQGDGLC